METLKFEHERNMKTAIAEHQDLGSRQQTLVDKLNQALRDSIQENEKVRVF